MFHMAASLNRLRRILVFIQWAWSYFTYERGARLITGSTRIPGWTEPRSRVSSASDEQEISLMIHK